jgi:hypothetical protein
MNTNITEPSDRLALVRDGRLNWIGNINRMDDTRRVKKNFSSQLEGVRTKGRPRSRWWECVWRDIKGE